MSGLQYVGQVLNSNNIAKSQHKWLWVTLGLPKGLNANGFTYVILIWVEIVTNRDPRDNRFLRLRRTASGHFNPPQLDQKNYKIVSRVILQPSRSAWDCCSCSNRLLLYCWVQVTINGHRLSAVPRYHVTVFVTLPPRGWEGHPFTWHTPEKRVPLPPSLLCDRKG